jgi:hypothetical protein
MYANCEIVNAFEPPSHINGIAVKKTWNEAGTRTHAKNIVVSYHGNFRVAKCPDGYVILCSVVGCKNLGTKVTFKCVSHHKGQEVYAFCRNNTCVTTPLFGLEYNKPFYCSGHKEDNMYDVKHEKCLECPLRPNFGSVGGKAQYCFQHKKDDMGDITHRKCEDITCDTRPTYGHKDHKVRFCEQHKLPGMYNTSAKICEEPNCDIQAIFGNRGEQKYQFCTSHKHEGMIDLAHKLCRNPKCDLHPNFGFEGQKALCCYQHKEEGMIDIGHKRCKDCTKRAFYGYKGENVQYCKGHKHENMINVEAKICENSVCKKQACFGIEGEKPQYCKGHKFDIMINIKSKRCENETCTVLPSYGKLYSRILKSCVAHTCLNYYNRAKLSPLCQVINCCDIAYFVNFEDSNVYPIRCGTHHLLTDIELIFKLCPNCGDELYFPSNKKVCMDCGNYREKKLHRFKETIIKHFLTSNNIPFVYDRPVSINGSKSRPDFLIQSKFGYIVVEVDEHQHKKYIQEEEIARMNTIHSDIQLIRSNSQVLFIRFNPDEYIGIQCELKNRHKYLHDIVSHFIDQKTIGIPLAQLKLFFDEFNEKPIIESLSYFTL